MLVPRGSDASPRCTKATEHLRGPLCLSSPPKPALLSRGSRQAPREHGMSTLEWEDAADCYLSLRALSSPEIRNSSTKSPFCSTKRWEELREYTYKHEEGMCIRHPFSPPLFLQCLTLNLKGIFRVKHPEKAQEQTEEPGTQPLHYSSTWEGGGGG